MKNIKKIIALITDVDHMRLYYIDGDSVTEVEHKKFTDHSDQAIKKRIDTEIDAVALLLKKHPNTEEFILAGTKSFIKHFYNVMPDEIQKICKKIPADHEINIHNLIDKAHELK